MEGEFIILLVLAVVIALTLGALIAVTTSLLMTSRAIKNQLNELDKNLYELVTVMNSLSETSQEELQQLHETLAEQQRVHQSIRSTSRLIDIVFKRPVVSAAAAKHAKNKFQQKRNFENPRKRNRNV